MAYWPALKSAGFKWAASMIMDQGAIAVGPLFIDKNVIGEHLDLRVRVDDILNRDALTKHSTLDSEGTQSTIALTRRNTPTIHVL